MSEYPDTYDAILERHRGQLPMAYLKALIRGESGFKPDLVASSGATGLLQVVQVVLTDYNKRHGTTWTKADMTNPERNIAVACWQLNVIVDAYAASGFAALKPNWSSIRWVTLLTLGWNAGWSMAAGVQRVVSHLVSAASKASGDESWWRKIPAVAVFDWLTGRKAGDKPAWSRDTGSITGDDVVAHAKRAGASKNLWTTAEGGKGTKKLAWCKKVVAWYEQLKRLPPGSQPTTGGPPWVLLLLAVALLSRKRR